MFDDLSDPSDTLLALSVRCVVRNIASPVGPTCKAEARRHVHLEQLRHLPSDLSQRIFDELVRTRSLTKEVAANFRGCHLLDARLDAYPGLEDTWLEASWVGGGGGGGNSLFMLLPRFVTLFFSSPPHRLDVSSYARFFAPSCSAPIRCVLLAPTPPALLLLPIRITFFFLTCILCVGGTFSGGVVRRRTGPVAREPVGVRCADQLWSAAPVGVHGGDAPRPRWGPTLSTTTPPKE